MTTARQVAVGSVVRHTRFGLGRVVGGGGLQFRVAFELLGDQIREVRVEDLTVTAEGTDRATQTPSREVGAVATRKVQRTAEGQPEEPGRKPAHQHAKRLVVECLRQGVPPPGAVSSWTVGFTRPQAQLQRALESAANAGRGVVLVVEATYGQGKTHLGRLASELALEQRFIAMHAELDGEAVTLRRDGVPLLNRLFASIRILATSADNGAHVPGLGSLLRRAPARLQRDLPPELGSFAAFLSCKDDWDGNEEAIELLERYLAGETRLRLESDLRDVLGMPNLGLPSFRMGYGTVQSRLRAQADQLKRVVRLGMEIGARGALVVVDEFDHDLRRATFRERGRIVATLNSFIGLASEEPIVFLLLAPKDGFEFTGVEHLELPSLRDSDLQKVTLRALEAYEAAFPNQRLRGHDRLFAQLLDRFNMEFQREGWGARFFVRAAIEACDLAIATGVSLDLIPLRR